MLVRRRTANDIEEAINNIESSFNKRINLLSDNIDNNEAVVLFKKELLQLRFDLEKIYSDFKSMSNESIETKNIKLISDFEFNSRINTMNENFNIIVSDLKNRLAKLEKELALSKRKLEDFNLAIDMETNKNFIEHVKSLKELENNFSEIALAVLKMEAKNDISGTPWSIVNSTLKSIFVFRSTSPKEGFTSDAILSRAEHELTKGNFENCLRELSYLNDNSANLFLDWKLDLKKFMDKND